MVVFRGLSIIGTEEIQNKKKEAICIALLKLSLFLRVFFPELSGSAKKREELQNGVHRKWF